MGNYEINPHNKKGELCSLLEQLNCHYEIHLSNKDNGYEWLNDRDICIAIPNTNSEDSIYLVLEYEGEFILFFYEWHSHYFPNNEYYNLMIHDLLDILNDNKCVIIINSKKIFLSSSLSDLKIDKYYNYKNNIKKLPEEFQEELKELGGNVELLYWNAKDNVNINI